MFEVISEKPPSFVARHKVLVFVMLGVIAAIAYVGNQYRVASLQAEESARIERQWLVATARRINDLSERVRAFAAEVDRTAKANSEPLRTGGREVPREKWAPKAERAYSDSVSVRDLYARKLDLLVGEYNVRRAEYRGSWPAEVEPPPERLSGSGVDYK